MAGKAPEVTFDRKKFQRLAGKAFTKVVGVALEEINKQITEKRRDYPVGRVTKRKSGQVVVGGPRDVVDLGELRDSYKEKESVAANFGGEKVTVGATWNAPHATYIYFGTRYQPAYPWVKIGLRRIDLAALYRKELKKIP